MTELPENWGDYDPEALVTRLAAESSSVDWQLFNESENLSAPADLEVLQDATLANLSNEQSRQCAQLMWQKWEST